ncbi:MAG: CvpA family protein [Alphaproteobacteria bacterium]|nr:CvpA family protein [Alphaproteobacteria bacterium]
MFDLTILDYVYIGVVLASTVWATIRGGVYETVATLSWIVAAISARFASPWLDKLLQSWFDLSDSTVGTLIASYFVVFFTVLLLVGILNQKLRDKIQDSIMNITDKTLGVIFGIIRGVVVMGGVYWGALWYYSDMPFLPQWLSQARMRPVMQITAVKLDEWFFPGPENKLLARDMAGAREAIEIYQNLINPAVTKKLKESEESAEGTGYKSSERAALENQLLQIESVANAIEQNEETSDNEINLDTTTLTE